VVYCTYNDCRYKEIDVENQEVKDQNTDVDQVVARWIAEEESACAHLIAPGVATPDQLAGLSGLEFFQGIREGRLPPAPIGDTLDFVAIRIDPGSVVFQGRPHRRHYNPLGTVHGGWFATLLDTAVGCAVHSTLLAGKGFTTLELKVNMVRALTDRVPLVRAEGRLVHAGRQVATAEGRIVGPDGKLYAHATTTCLISDHPELKRKADQATAVAVTQ
jgi:uncharacterized protein (TIGR00369 family)